MKKFLLLFLAIAGMVSTASADEDYWTVVAGSTDIINGENTWAPTVVANKMTESGGVYTLTVTGKSLTKGSYEYKVAKNGTWDVAYPSGGTNQSLVVPETATYTIVYTFNGSDNLTAAISKTANGTSYTYKVSGHQDLTGYNWGTDEVNMMSSDESVKVNYSLTLTGKTLTDGVEYGFKVLQDRSFDTSWPGSNYNVIVHPSGTYDVTFNFNVNTQTVTATAWCTDVRSIIGDFFDDPSDWKTDKVMTQDPSNQNLYTLTVRGISLSAKTYNYKLRSNKAWGGYQLPSDATNKTYVCSTAGIYDLVFTANTSSHTLTLEATQVGDQSVTVSAAGYATLVSPYALDFTSTTIKAYTASVNTTNGKVTLSNINVVPANTPVVLYKEGGETEDIPVTTSDAVVASDLVPGTGATVPTTDGAGNYNYILNNVSGIGFYKANGQTVAANRAYLQTTYNVDATPGSRMVMVFADETTGIKEYNVKAISNRYFDLQGRSVAQPTKGLYIVNGKKVIK